MSTWPMSSESRRDKGDESLTGNHPFPNCSGRHTLTPESHIRGLEHILFGDTSKGPSMRQLRLAAAAGSAVMLATFTATAAPATTLPSVLPLAAQAPESAITDAAAAADPVA